MSSPMLEQGSQSIREDKKRLTVVNPATLEKIREVPITEPEGVKVAVARARQAFGGWRELSFRDRTRHLLTLRDVILDSKTEIVDTIVAETGKTRMEALSAEVLYVCAAIDYYTKRAEEFLRERSHPVDLVLLKSKRVLTAYLPRGVVGIIAPWNFPFMMTMGESVPALMAGNAVVVKPSEFTPLSALLAQGLAEQSGLPHNLFQVATGFGETGEALIDHADQIAFTGSVATGKKVMARAAQTLKPVTLELGGKDPMIVLRDASLERAANGAVWGSLMNSGQVCMSVERVYVEEPVADAFIAKVTEKVGVLRQGIDSNMSVDVGSMTTPRQLAIVEDHVADAVAKGAKILVGGKRKAELPGLFYEPTVLVDVDHSMKIMTDETFGPVIPMMRVKNEEEALRLANESRYGLNSSVWTRNQRKARTLARRLEAGNVCINDCLVDYLVTEVPFGGTKESGIGYRHGEGGIRKYCILQTVLEDRLGLRRELIWYPYSRKFAAFLSRFLKVLYHSRWLGKFS